MRVPNLKEAAEAWTTAVWRLGMPRAPQESFLPALLGIVPPLLQVPSSASNT